MPTYGYVCEDCGHEFTKFQRMNDDHLKTCPECGKETLKRKLGTGAGIIFKGSGFYCTDYCKSGARPTDCSAAKKDSSGGCCCAGDCKHNH